MGSLHIINRSSAQAWQACLKSCQSDDAIILIEDGVLIADQLASQDRLPTCYILLADLEARGLGAQGIEPAIQPINYRQFVQLCVNYQRTLTWN